MKDCMLYAGYKSDKGYARRVVKIDGKWKPMQLHREIYLAYRGEIPEGLVIDHQCNVRCCINPDHLKPMTNAENISRGNRPAVYTDTCNQGHILKDVGMNVYKDGRRACKECKRISWQKYKLRRDATV